MVRGGRGGMERVIQGKSERMLKWWASQGKEGDGRG